MVNMRERLSSLSSSPSFNTYSGNRLEEIAARVISELADEEETDAFALISADQPVAPSSSSSSSSRRIGKEAATLEEESDARAHKEDDENGSDDSDEVDEDEDEFEFEFVVRDPDASPIAADEIFANGRIRPMFPVFNRDVWFEDSAAQDGDKKGGRPEPPTAGVRVPLHKLFVEDREPASSSSSGGDELETLPPGSYCVWTPRSVPPSPDGCKKSNSTGSSKRWRFKDLLHRSSSDGKETFLFLSPSASGKDGKPDAGKGKKVLPHPGAEARRPRSSETSRAMVSAHELHYVRNRAIKEGDRRRSFLPYRQDIVGFFANVNGLSRTLHPF